MQQRSLFKNAARHERNRGRQIVSLAKVFQLLSPVHRKWLQKPRQRHLWLLPTIQDDIDDVWREQRQPENARHVGGCDPLALGEFGDCGKCPQPVTVFPAQGIQTNAMNTNLDQSQRL